MTIKKLRNFFKFKIFELIALKTKLIFKRDNINEKTDNNIRMK